MKSEMGYVFKRLDLKTVLENDIFGLKYGQDFENRAAHPQQELPREPPSSGHETHHRPQMTG